MRYQSKPARSHSYLLSSKETTQISKENKENHNILNIRHNQPLKPKLSDKISDTSSTNIPFKGSELPALKSKISQQSTSTLTTVFNKLEVQPVSLKHQYSTHTALSYSEDILAHYCAESKPCEDFLKDHAITANLRAKMVDWVIEVLSSYKMSQDTFFRSVKIMDSFLKKTTTHQEIKDLHLIGVAAMFSATKYEQIYPIKLDTMYDRIARKKFRRQEILSKESQLLTSLNFRMEEVNVYDILKNVTFEMKLNINEDQKQYLDQIVLYLAKMSLFSYELAQEDTKLLASAVFFIALKTLEQVEPKLKPEEHLQTIGQMLTTSEEKMIEVSRKVLDLAKNFSTVYPNLGNLKKFNKFEYKKKATVRVV